MSIEQLVADVRDNIKALASLGPVPTTVEIVAHLRNSLWPTIEVLADQLAEVDGCVEDMLHSAEDILQPETAELMAGVIVGGRALAHELAKRIGVGDPLHKVISEYVKLTQEAERTLAEITVARADDDDDDDDDDGDDDGNESTAGTADDPQE